MSWYEGMDFKVMLDKMPHSSLIPGYRLHFVLYTWFWTLRWVESGIKATKKNLTYYLPTHFIYSHFVYYCLNRPINGYL